jgi:tetratricopeptide (TPR) repeat protein
MTQHTPKDRAVLILEKDRDRVVLGETRDRYVIETKPVLDDLLEVVRGIRLYHNPQRTHGCLSFDIVGGSSEVSQVVLSLGESYLMAGHQDDAMDLARQALELSQASNERGHQVLALRLLGEIAAQREPPHVKEAVAHCRQALALAEELGMRPLQAHTHLGLGTHYAETGQREQAHAELTAAIDLYRAMGMTFWLPQAEAALASLRGDAG